MKVKCDDCYYWEKNKDSNFGKCHKNPPTVLGWTEVSIRDGWSEFKTATFAPEPHADFWCGEWMDRSRAIESEAKLEEMIKESGLKI